MSTHADREPGTIPRRAWTDSCGNQLRLAPAAPVGPRLQLLTIAQADGPKAAIELDSARLRELAAEALERADALDNVAARYRRTPNWHIREGEKRLGIARQLLNHGMDPQVAGAEAAVAQAHFQAAQAKRVHTSAPVTTNESGRDTE